MRKNANLKLLALLGLILCVMMPRSSSAADVLIYAGDNEYELRQNILILDSNDTGGDVTLQFGRTLNEALTWDSANTRFVFSDDLRTEGNLAVVGGAFVANDHSATDSNGALNLGRNDSSWESLNWNSAGDRFDLSNDLNITGNLELTGTVDGVDVSNTGSSLSIHLNGGANKHDATEIDVETAGNITTVNNLETNLGAFDAAIGNRSYTVNNYVTDGQSITASIDALDQAVSGAGHAQNTDTGTTSNTFILDNDNTGGDVAVQFGATLAKAFGWDSSETSFSTFNEQLAFRVRQSATPPVSCGATVAGMQWMDTDTGMLYICDTSNSRNKWLSVQDLSIWGEDTGTCNRGRDTSNDTDCTVNWGGSLGSNGSTDLGFYLPHPITITGYGFSEDNDACTSGSFDVELRGTGSGSNDNDFNILIDIATGLNDEAHNSNALNINVAGDQYILWGLDNNCGQDIDDWNVILYYRWRHD